MKHFYKGNWAVENVNPYYKPLVNPAAIVERHLVWSNRPIESRSFKREYLGRITDQSKETLASAYGIVLPVGTKNQRKLLRNAVLPEMGKYVFDQVHDS